MQVREVYMFILTVDSERRITLPQELGILPGQRIELTVSENHWTLAPMQTITENIPQAEFETLLKETAETYAETFRKLAKE